MLLDRAVAAIDRLRRRRGPSLVVANLRLAIGFAFAPAGLKKLLGERFTDAGNQGVFHDFLHGFHATGGFYRFVGALQLVAAVLLMTQRRATAGAALALPIATAIMAFCWSTARAPTVIVTTLLVLGLAALLVWDLRAWRGVLDGRASSPATSFPGSSPTSPAPIDESLWALCGLAVLLVYGGLCLAMGEVYRPRRPTPDSAAYYVLPGLVLLPIATAWIERRRRRTR